MRMYDIIRNKRDGQPLSDQEIDFFVREYSKGSIPDYQAAALLMAIFLKGMDPRETAALTDCMAKSGDIVDLSAIPGIKVDKHSTGGVGDKTSLIIGPIAAACGAVVAKMSGRGLGHTGGTVDKLEAIPGLRTAVDREEFFRVVREAGIAIIGQSGNIAPADKKLYALRDVTATVEHLSLIASSIMSKKLAAGSDAILLDVKTGSGAFMKTLEDSISLAKAMVDIGCRNQKNTMALITDMDTPLGYAIGNSLEVIEAVETLRGKGPADLTAVCLELAANMLVLAERGSLEECRQMARHAIDSGEAFRRLVGMVKAQGGDTAVLEDPSKFPKALVTASLPADRSGFLRHINTEACGIASVSLGAGRERKEDTVDYSAGILLRKKPGDRVAAGETLAELYTSSQEMLPEAMKLLRNTMEIGGEPPRPVPMLYARVTAGGVELMGSLIG